MPLVPVHHKAIIVGTLYDSQRADLVATFESKGARSDFTYWRASIYQRPRSLDYFLAGEGGAFTMFATVEATERKPGKRIIPLTDAQAFRWLQHYSNPTTLNKHFPSMPAEISDKRKRS